MSGGGLNLGNGLSLSAGGSVSLGTGSLTSNDFTSGMSGRTLSAANQYVGKGGTGMFLQSAGTNTLSSGLTLGSNPADSGVYVISGSGQLSAPVTQVGYSGTGNFSQFGGTSTLGTFYLGYASTGKGDLNLGAGTACPAATEEVGFVGTGTLTQSGGTNAVSGSLYLGYAGGAAGTYNQSATGHDGRWLLVHGIQLRQHGHLYALSGTGSLSAPTEYVGNNSTAAATFSQTGGSNCPTNLSIGAGDHYVLSGGTLTISGGVTNNGDDRWRRRGGHLGANCLVDMTAGTWKNYSGVVRQHGQRGLVIVPAGYNVSTDSRASPAGIGSSRTWHDIDGPGRQGIDRHRHDQRFRQLPRHGLLPLRPRRFQLRQRTESVGHGSVNLERRQPDGQRYGLRHERRPLAGTNQYVGSGGTGLFTHSGGNQHALDRLYLGYNSADAGTYNLSGTGKLSAPVGTSVIPARGC